MLEGRGERVHRMSEHLSSEVAHIDSKLAEHDLHYFQTWRRMDEILIANFMTFDDLVEKECSLTAGDGARSRETHIIAAAMCQEDFMPSYLSLVNWTEQGIKRREIGSGPLGCSQAGSARRRRPRHLLLHYAGPVGPCDSHGVAR